MRIPSVHLNGTGRTSLMEELGEAYSAVGSALHSLSQVTVHGRDYYVQDVDAYTEARAEMDVRLNALRAVRRDLLAMYSGILEQ